MRVLLAAVRPSRSGPSLRQAKRVAEQARSLLMERRSFCGRNMPRALVLGLLRSSDSREWASSAGNLDQETCHEYARTSEESCGSSSKASRSAGLPTRGT